MAQDTRSAGYSRKYYQKNKERLNKRTVARNRRYREMYPERKRYEKLKGRSKTAGMPFVMTSQEFSDWFIKTEKKCAYCDLIDLGLDRIFMKGQVLRHFTIDRKYVELPYSIENICFACWTCNHLKSNYFNYDEFREIAQKYIKPKWMSKLARITV